MKNALKIVTTIFCAAYLLLISCGFTISHVYCPEGEQWVMGSEMPPCKNSSQAVSSCCESKNECVNAPEKKKDSRKKDTYEFKLDIEGKKTSAQEIKLISFDLQGSSITLTTDATLFQRKATKSDLFEFHPPPDLLKPDLIKLQVFLI